MRDKQLEALRGVDVMKAAAELRRLRAENAELLDVLSALMRRVELNNGLGEYQGGDPFVMERARKALAKAEGKA